MVQGQRLDLGGKKSVHIENLVCPVCRKSLLERGGELACQYCGRTAFLTSGGRRLDFSAFLSGSDEKTARVGMAYSFYSKLYAPLALLNMLTVWRASLGKLVNHYRSALSAGKEEILDVAVGDGSLSRLALKRVSGNCSRVIGLDISADMLRKAEIQLPPAAGYSFVLADARALPYRNGAFSRICCYGGLHVMAHPHEAMRAMNDALAPGGTFYASILTRPRGKVSRKLADDYVKLGFLSSNFSCTDAEKMISTSGLRLLNSEMNGCMLLITAGKE